MDEARAEPAGCSSSRLTVGKGLQGPARCQHLRHGGGLQAFQLSSGLFRAVTALLCEKHPLTLTGGSVGAVVPLVQAGCWWPRGVAMDIDLPGEGMRFPLDVASACAPSIPRELGYPGLGGATSPPNQTPPGRPGHAAPGVPSVPALARS